MGERDELEQQFARDGDYDDYYEEVVQHIAAQGTPGLSYLKKVVQEDKMEVPQLRAALWILSLQGEEPWYRERLQTLLQDSRELIVAEAIDGLASFKARDLSETILQLYSHPSPYVKGSVLRYMSNLFPNEAPPMLIKALKDPHYIVRENAVDELDDLEYDQALPDIRALLRAGEHEDVIQAAETAIENLIMVREDREAAAREKEAKKRSISTHSYTMQPDSTYL